MGIVRTPRAKTIDKCRTGYRAKEPREEEGLPAASLFLLPSEAAGSRLDTMARTVPICREGKVQEQIRITESRILYQ